VPEDIAKFKKTDKGAYDLTIEDYTIGERKVRIGISCTEQGIFAVVHDKDGNLIARKQIEMPGCSKLSYKEKRELVEQFVKDVNTLSALDKFVEENPLKISQDALEMTEIRLRLIEHREYIKWPQDYQLVLNAIQYMCWDYYGEFIRLNERVLADKALEIFLHNIAGSPTEVERHNAVEKIINRAGFTCDPPIVYAKVFSLAAQLDDDDDMFLAAASITGVVNFASWLGVLRELLCSQIHSALIIK